MRINQFPSGQGVPPPDVVTSPPSLEADSANPEASTGLLQNRDLPGVVEVMLNDAVQHVIERISLPQDDFL